MDCQRAQNQIPAYRAGRLDTPDRRALECHLSGCHRCARCFAQADSGPAEIRAEAAWDHRRTGQPPLRILL